MAVRLVLSNAEEGSSNSLSPDCFLCRKKWLRLKYAVLLYDVVTSLQMAPHACDITVFKRKFSKNWPECDKNTLLGNLLQNSFTLENLIPIIDCNTSSDTLHFNKLKCTSGCHWRQLVVSETPIFYKHWAEHRLYT